MSKCELCDRIMERGKKRELGSCGRLLCERCISGDVDRLWPESASKVKRTEMKVTCLRCHKELQYEIKVSLATDINRGPGFKMAICEIGVESCDCAASQTE